MAGKASLPKTLVDESVKNDKERKKQFGRERAGFAKVDLTATGGVGYNYATSGVPSSPLGNQLDDTANSSLSNLVTTSINSNLTFQAQKQIANLDALSFTTYATPATLAAGSIRFDGTDLIGKSSSGDVNLTSGGSGSGATRELDNLQNTAVNADIIPDTASSWDLGSLAKPFDRTYSDEVVFVTEGAISTNKPTIGWGNSTRGMTFSLHSLGSTQTGWTWEEATSTKMTLTTGGLLTVNTMLSTGLLRAEGNTELGNADTDTVTFTAKVNSDLKVSGSHDLGDSSTYWDYGYIFNGRFNNIEIDGDDAKLDMKNNDIKNVSDLYFDGSESIYVTESNGSFNEVMKFHAASQDNKVEIKKDVEITKSGGKLKLAGSYIQFNDGNTANLPTGDPDGWVYVYNSAGDLKKLGYWDP